MVPVPDNTKTTNKQVGGILPPDLHPQAAPQELKARLDWGEPALTIIDVRDRSQFNQQRIMGAISMPVESLVAAAQAALELKRDIYVYGSQDSDTANAANALREQGYERVAELQGGLQGWIAIAGPVEGRASA